MSRAAALRASAISTPALQVRLVGPESSLPSPADLRRLFAHRPLPPRRRDRFSASPKVLACLGSRLVGLASFERTDHELRVHELAFDPERPADLHDVLRGLIDALELACLASGVRRLVLLPTAVLAVSPLERMGYHLINEGCAGAWLEKIFV